MTNKACQVNFDEINNENCYRSGCQALQNKKMAEEIKFLRGQISKKDFIIRSLFSLKLPNREEDNLFHKVRKNTNGTNICDSCTNDQIPQCKCVNGPIKRNFKPTPHHSSSVQLKSNLIKEKIPPQ